MESPVTLIKKLQQQRIEKKILMHFDKKVSKAMMWDVSQVEAIEILPIDYSFKKVTRTKHAKAKPDQFIYYYYNGPQDKKNRPFCKHMMQMDKVFSSELIDQMSQILGYSVLKFKGSYGCRHQWIRFRGKEVLDGGNYQVPTDKQIQKLIYDQIDSGLADL